MGAKTAMLAFADGDIAKVLRRPAPATDPAAAERLLRRLAPGWEIEPCRDEVLAEANYPPEDTVYVLSVPGLDLVCGLHWLRSGRDGWLPEHVLAEGAERRTIYHRMHSGTDSVEFALWHHGRLERAIAIDGENGVVEDTGERLPFEAAFWNGEHPHEPSKWIVDAGPSPFPTPFHPIGFGIDAVRALFGFIVEGRLAPGDVDVHSVRLTGFTVRDPNGPSPGERKEALREAAGRLVRQSYTVEMAPDGRIVFVPVDMPPSPTPGI